MDKNKKKILGVFVILVAVGAMMTCSKKEEKVATQVETTTEGTPAVVEVIKKPVTVINVSQEEIADTYSTDGTLVPQKSVIHRLDSQATIKNVLKKNGQYVKKGEVIVEFSDATAKAAFDSAKANFGSAEASLEAAKINFEKYKVLFAKQMVSELEYLSYKKTYTDALGLYNSSKANLEDSKSMFGKLNRKAELSGYVGNLNLKVGNIVEKNEALFTIVDSSNMEVTVDFPGKWIDTIEAGSPAKVRVTDLNGKIFDAKVKNINPIANSETKKFPVKLIISNPNNQIKDGMYTKVSIPAAKRDALVVPQESVFIRDLLSYIYKVENGVAKRVEVKTGAISVPNIEVISDNLKVGDIIVVDGVYGLSDNDEVKIVTEEEAKQADVEAVAEPVENDKK